MAEQGWPGNRPGPGCSGRWRHRQQVAGSRWVLPSVRQISSSMPELCVSRPTAISVLPSGSAVTGALAGRFAALSAPVVGAAGATSAEGSSIQKQLPSPGWLAKPMLPLINSTRRRVMARPMPVPSIFSSARRSKGRKTRSTCSGAMPAPVSWTPRRHRPSARLQVMRTSPSGRLYLIALETRLMTTCLSRLRSARTVSSGGMSCCIRMPRPAARGETRVRHSSIKRASLTSSMSITSLPASMADRSSTSLIRESRWRPPCSM